MGRGGGAPGALQGCRGASMRKLAFAVSMAIAAHGGLAGPAAAQARGAAQADAYLFAFQDAEISQVVREVLGAVGAPFVIDPAVTGKMSLRIEQRLTKAQLLEALDAALAANGMTLVRDGDTLLVTPRAKAKTAAGVRPYREGERRVGFEVVAVPLSYAQPTEVAKAIEAISGSGAVLLANDRLGLIILGGSSQELDATLATLKMFDQSGFSDSKLRWFELNQASAPVVAEEIERLVQGGGMAGVSVVPLKRLNGLIVFGRSTQALDEIAKWVAKLDTPGKEAASNLWVYHPRHTSAEALAQTLNSFLGGQARGGSAVGETTPSVAAANAAVDKTAAPRMDVLEDGLRVGVDKESNTLLVFGAPASLVKIQRVLAEIDRLPGQILIEASILEVTLGDDFQFGVDWSAVSGEFGFGSINNSAGKVAAQSPGGSITFFNGTVAAAVNALGSLTAVQVVSAPKIIVLDNKTARLQIGDQVPVVSQSSQGTTTPNAPVINSVDYRSTGVILSVSPRISGEDQVTMEVTQEVSSVGKTQTSGIDSPTIKQRRFESTLILQSGKVAALGGLISSSMTKSNSGVPYLKDAPGIGALFRTNGHNQNRTELIVLLTAKIVRDPATASRAMSDLYDDMKELSARGLLAGP
jgi:general secretion pathway protein D